MRKVLFFLLIALVLVLSVSALADDYYLAPAGAEVTVKLNKTTVLTAENAEEHKSLLSDIGVSKNDLVADFAARGVVLQAWSPINTKYTCLEITVTRDDQSALYPDLISRSANDADWKAFTAFYKNNEKWTADGYTFNYTKNHFGKARSGSANFLLLEYKRVVGSKTYRGYMAKTTYEGYMITFDYQVYNQALVAQHRTNMYNVVKTFRKAEIKAPAAPAETAETASGAEGGTAASEAAPAATVPANSVRLEIKKAPPKETNTNKFTVEGVTEPGAEVIGVLMPITYSYAIQEKVTAHKRTGAFKLNMTIPVAEEMTWQMTLNVYVGEKNVANEVFDVTEYKKTLIPLELDEEIPEVYAGNELVVAGTTIQGVLVQCICTSVDGTWEKQSRPNNTGRFTFKIPMKSEGEYSIALVLSKKNFDTKRKTYTVSRYITDEARNAQIRKEAKRVGYNAVASRIDQYYDQVLSFTAWVTKIEQVGNEWKITAAGTKTGDHYGQEMIFIAAQEPSFAVEEKHTFYGRCIGAYKYLSEETTENVPSFDLLVWD